jgi:hypothetical protein
MDAADRRAIDDHIVLIVPGAWLPVVGALGSQEKFMPPLRTKDERNSRGLRQIRLRARGHEVIRNGLLSKWLSRIKGGPR